MFRAVILICGLVCAATSAQASGLWFTRLPETTTFRECSGSLVEKLVAESAITNRGHDYMLICLTGQNRAAWVFRAGFHCDSTLGDDAKDDPYQVSKTWCKDENYHALSDDQIMIKGDHSMDKTTIEWHFIRYGIGTDCYYTLSSWECKDVKVRFDQDLSLTTKGSKKFTVDMSDTANRWFADFANTIGVACLMGRHGPKQHPEPDCSGKDTTF